MKYITTFFSVINSEKFFKVKYRIIQNRSKKGILYSTAVFNKSALLAAATKTPSSVLYKY